MAKKDEVTVEKDYQCTKEVHCGCCGTVFQFVVYKFKVDGKGATEQEALRDVASKAKEALTADTGEQRCPTCGILQESMTADMTAFSHGCAMWFAGIVFVVTSLLAGLINQLIISSISPFLLGAVSTALYLLAVAWNVYTVRRNFNSNLHQQVEEVKGKLDEAKVEVIFLGNDSSLPDSLPHQVTAFQAILLVLSIVGLFGLHSAEIVRVLSGWKTNAATYPPVAGPGDEVTLYWPNSLSCLKGKWRGTAQVEYTDADGKLPKKPLPAVCSTETWGQFIGGKGTSNRDTLIWTKVTLPSDADLVGKTIRLPASIVVDYPHSTGVFGFQDQQNKFQHEFQLVLSAPNSARIYEYSWLGGFIGSGALIFVTCFLLRRGQLNRMKNCPQPTTSNIRKTTE